MVDSLNSQSIFIDVLTASKTGHFEIGYTTYPKDGAVVVITDVVAHLLNRSILWPNGEQERK